MTASSFARHKVNDFAAWKKVYDEVRPLREGIVIAESVHQDPEDPNTVIVYHQYPDLSTAQAFLARFGSDDKEVQEVLIRAGVQPETMEVWVGGDA